MNIAEVTVPEKLRQFVERHADDHYCLELLQFFAAHPRTRFSKLAIIRALSVNGGRLGIERGLEHLVDNGAVRMRVENNNSLFSLAEDESLGNLKSGLPGLSWHQWRLLFSRINSTGAVPCRQGT